MKFRIDTPEDGAIKEVRKFAFFPKIVDDGKQRHLVWLEHYYAIYEYTWSAAVGHYWMLRSEFVEPIHYDPL